MARSWGNQYIVGPPTLKLGDQSPPAPTVVAPMSTHKDNIMNYCADFLEDKTDDYYKDKTDDYYKCSPLYCIPYCPQLKAYSYTQFLQVN